MAGVLAEGQKQNTDILFDLTPEDNKTLQESELLQLVNYGQLSKSYAFPGIDGKVYQVQFSALWDDDYLDVIQRTTRYAADPILRSRVMRRLILFKAIQRINERDFSNPEDIKAKRILWVVLCRMSDIMIQMLEARYKEMELENNMTVMEAVSGLSEKLEATKPDSLKKEMPKSAPTDEGDTKSEGAVTPESEPRFAPYSAGSAHEELIAQMKARQTTNLSEVTKAVETQVVLDESQPIVVSPKKT